MGASSAGLAVRIEPLHIPGDIIVDHLGHARWGAMSGAGEAAAGALVDLWEAWLKTLAIRGFPAGHGCLWC